MTKQEKANIMLRNYLLGKPAMYTYDEAVEYLEKHGVHCDVCQFNEAELACDLLDERYDEFELDETFYTEKTLKGIIKDVKREIRELNAN